MNRTLAVADRGLAATSRFGETMSFTQAIASGFANYARFARRATRSEYWFWVLFTFLVSMLALVLDHVVAPKSELFSELWNLATLLPSLAVGVRRLHDTNRSGWWLLLLLVPLIGWIALTILLCLEGSPGYNRFGPNPLPAPPGPRHRFREVAP